MEWSEELAGGLLQATPDAVPVLNDPPPASVPSAEPPSTAARGETLLVAVRRRLDD